MKNEIMKVILPISNPSIANLTWVIPTVSIIREALRTLATIKEDYKTDADQ